MYTKLDKNLRKETKLRFYKTDIGINTKNRILRVYVSIILLLIYFLYLFFFSNETGIDIYLMIVSIVSAVILYLFTIKVKIDLYNEYLTHGEKN